MGNDLDELTDNIEIVYKKMLRIEKFLMSVTIGISVLFIVMMVILFMIFLR